MVLKRKKYYLKTYKAKIFQFINYNNFYYFINIKNLNCK